MYLYEQELLDRLRTLHADGTKVYSAPDLKTAKELGQHTPGVALVYDRATAGESSADNGACEVRHRFMTALLARSARDQHTGRSARDAVTAMSVATVNGLLGWRPPGQATGGAARFAGAGAPEHANGLLAQTLHWEMTYKADGRGGAGPKPRIGELELDPATAEIEETLERGENVETRKIRIERVWRDGVRSEHEAGLEALSAAANNGDGTVYLRLRPGRRIAARLTRVERKIARTGPGARWTGEFTAAAAREESEEETRLDWAITERVAQETVVNAGTAPAQPVITFTAADWILWPGFEAGGARLRHEGVLAPNETLIIDSAAQRVTKNGTDVTGETEGSFPVILPGTQIVEYKDDLDSSHMGSAVVTWRAAWW